MGVQLLLINAILPKTNTYCNNVRTTSMIVLGTKSKVAIPANVDPTGRVLQQSILLLYL